MDEMGAGDPQADDRRRPRLLQKAVTAPSAAQKVQGTAAGKCTLHRGAGSCAHGAGSGGVDDEASNRR